MTETTEQTETVIDTKPVETEPVNPEPATVEANATETQPPPSENIGTTVPNPDGVTVKCSKCETVFDVVTNQRMCPNCGTVRRGRMPGQKPTQRAPGEPPKINIKNEAPKQAPQAATQAPASKVRKLTQEDFFKPLTPFEEQLAGIPVAMVHQTLAKKRGYGITKDEAEKGKVAFGMLVRKYENYLTEYMPEMMCAGWVISVVIQPDVSPSDFAKMQQDGNK